MSRIQVMFDPKTIAFFGATEKEGKVHHAAKKRLIRTNKLQDVIHLPGSFLSFLLRVVRSFHAL